MPRKRQHPYRKLVLPPNAPFELRPIPDKGWGAIAARPISKSCRVLHEPPLISIPDCLSLVTEPQLTALINALPPRQRAQIALLSINGDKDAPFTSNINLMTHNGFSRITDGLHGKRGLHPLASRFNHSCAPNLYDPASDGVNGVLFVASRDIPAGEELTFAYIDRLQCLIRAERHIALELECRCEACTLSPREQHVSDMRRRLIRGLYVLISGWDNVRNSVAAKDAFELPGLIPDAEQVRAAREDRVPLTSRLVYCLALIALMQAEGVLDDRIGMPLYDLLRETWASFRDRANKVYSDKVLLAGRTAGWRWKFAAMSRLYGRADSGDQIKEDADMRKTRGFVMALPGERFPRY